MSNANWYDDADDLALGTVVKLPSVTGQPLSALRAFVDELIRQEGEDTILLEGSLEDDFSTLVLDRVSPEESEE